MALKKVISFRSVAGELEQKPFEAARNRSIGGPVITNVSTDWQLLKLPVLPVDNTGMIDIVLTELADVPHWQTLLTCYREQHLQAKTADPEYDGWVPRIRILPEIEGEPLSQLHGRLIALGLLKFELGGRAGGMTYQVSSLGLRAMAGLPDEDEANGDVDADLESDDTSPLAA